MPRRTTGPNRPPLEVPTQRRPLRSRSVRIPSGDLSPARHRRYGGGYGRRRRRTTRTLVLALLVVVIGGGAAYALRRDDSGAAARQTSTPCPSAVPEPTKAIPSPLALPQPQQVRLALLNGTARDGLATDIGNQLAARGFLITQAVTAPAALAGASTVSYGPGGLPAATVVARTVLGSTLVSAPAAPSGSVRVILGSEFRRLSTPAEVRAAAERTAVPTPRRTAAAPIPTRSACS